MASGLPSGWQLELLRIYHFYMRTLGFELLPRLVLRTLGEAGFGPLARLYADATRSYIERYIGRREPRELLEMMARVAAEAREAIGEEPLFDFTVSLEDNRLIIDAPMGLESQEDLMRAAVLLGIVAGVIEASGRRTYVVTKRERARHLPGDAVVLYVEPGPRGLRIVAEYASRAAGERR